ncbi:MAG: type II toxin-antitoxin system VapB family antitoxin [Candidatus Binatia bacterium]
MRTTLDIDAKLLADAIAASGAPNKSAAVRLGLEALVSSAARHRLAALRGRLPDVQAPPRRRPLPADAPR